VTQASEKMLIPKNYQLFDAFRARRTSRQRMQSHLQRIGRLMWRLRHVVAVVRGRR